MEKSANVTQVTATDKSAQVFLENVYQTVRFLSALFLFVLVVVSIPVTVPISLAFRISRYLFSLYIDWHSNGQVTLIPGNDAVWLQDSENNRSIINAFLTLDGHLDVKICQEKYQARVIDYRLKSNERPYSKFQRYPDTAFQTYVWKWEENFDIGYHVWKHEGSLPATSEELHDVVNKLNLVQFKTNKSPWEMVIIPTAMEIPQTGVLLRAHHCMADGISFMELAIHVLMDEAEEEKKVVLPNRGYGSSKPSIWKAIYTAIFTPYFTVYNFCRFGDRHALHGPEPSGVKVMAWSEAIDLKDVKRLKGITGATVNDILMSCVTGAFRDVCVERKLIIPNEILASIPVDVRHANNKLQMDNEFSLVFLHLPVAMSNDRQRLAEMQRRIKDLKKSPEHLINAMILSYMMNRYPNLMTKPLFDHITRKCSLVLSNVPGPPESMFLFGHKVKMMVFWPPARCNVAFGVSILSYADEVRIGVRVDTSIMDNPDVLCEKFLEHFYSLQNEINANAEQ